MSDADDHHVVLHLPPGARRNAVQRAYRLAMLRLIARGSGGVEDLKRVELAYRALMKTALPDTIGDRFRALPMTQRWLYVGVFFMVLAVLAGMLPAPASVVLRLLFSGLGLLFLVVVFTRKVLEGVRPPKVTEHAMREQIEMLFAAARREELPPLEVAAPDEGVHAAEPMGYVRDDGTHVPLVSRGSSLPHEVQCIVHAIEGERSLDFTLSVLPVGDGEPRSLRSIRIHSLRPIGARDDVRIGVRIDEQGRLTIDAYDQSIDPNDDLQTLPVATGSYRA